MLKNRNESYIHQKQNQQFCVVPKTLLEHVCSLDIDNKPAYVRQTCIVCTAGESWSGEQQLEEMILGGANVIRLNMTLNTREHYAQLIKRIRKIEEKYNYNPCVSIAVDLTAPTVRSGMINKSLDGLITIMDGAKVVLTTDEQYKECSDLSHIYLDTQYFPDFTQYLGNGDKIFLDDGAVHLKVDSVKEDSIHCNVILGGELGSMKRVQLSHNRLYTPEHEKDYLADLEWAKQNKVDFVFTSLADTPEKITALKEILGPEIKVLPKIETREAVATLAKILAVSDGVIINRGALGVEYPHWKIFKLQKMLISQCNLANKPVFVIHQLLESMCYKPRATRAEVGDVANAVLDGADGLILAVETGRGEFPLETLRVMHLTCREAEGAIFHTQLQREMKTAQNALMFGDSPLSDKLPRLPLINLTMSTAAQAAVEAAFNIRASAILVPTISGRSAMEIAANRPSCPVVAIVRLAQVARQCHLHRGVHPFVYSGERNLEWHSDMDLRLNKALEHIRSRGFVSTDDVVVVVNGWNPTCGTTNTVRIIKVPKEGVDVTVLTQSVSKTEDNTWPED